MIAIGQRVAAQATAGALVIITLLTFLLHAPCRNSGYTDSRFTSFCYSDLPALLSAPPLGTGELPFTSTESVDLAPLSAWVAWGISRLPAGFDAKLIALQLVLAAALALTAWAIFAMRSWRRLDAAAMLLIPAWPFIAFVSMDLLSVAAAAVSLLLWKRQQTFAAAIAAGFALAAGAWTWLLLVVFAVDVWRRVEPRDALRFFARTVLTASVTAFVWNLPLLLSGSSLFSGMDLVAGEGTPLFIYSLLQGGATPSAWWVVASGLVVIVGIAFWAARLPFDFRPEALLLLLVSVQLLFSIGITPQQLSHVLWLLPLVWPTRAFLISTAGVFIAYVMAVWLRFEAASEGGKGIHEAWYAIFSLSLWVALAFIASRAVRVMTVQGSDIVERSRARR